MLFEMYILCWCAHIVLIWHEWCERTWNITMDSSSSINRSSNTRNTAMNVIFSRCILYRHKLNNATRDDEWCCKTISQRMWKNCLCSCLAKATMITIVDGILYIYFVIVLILCMMVSFVYQYFKIKIVLMVNKLKIDVIIMNYKFDILRDMTMTVSWIIILCIVVKMRY